jgi:threonine/homoserine/homoserine lactone efflux protein
VPEVSTIVFFGGASLAVRLVPGPTVLYVVARTVEQDRRAGLVSVLGVETGALIHVAAAAAGLSALVASSPAALTMLRYAGAAYLIWLAARSWHRSVGGDAAVDPSASGARVFRDAVLVDVLNPKTGLFFLAFLPSFVRPEQGSVTLQVVCLGVCFVALAAIVDGTYALLAERMTRWAPTGAAVKRRLARAGAGTYGLLGVIAIAGA